MRAVKRRGSLGAVRRRGTSAGARGRPARLVQTVGLGIGTTRRRGEVRAWASASAGGGSVCPAHGLGRRRGRCRSVKSRGWGGDNSVRRRGRAWPGLGMVRRGVRYGSSAWPVGGAGHGLGQSAGRGMGSASRRGAGCGWLGQSARRWCEAAGLSRPGRCGFGQSRGAVGLVTARQVSGRQRARIGSERPVGAAGKGKSARSGAGRFVGMGWSGTACQRARDGMARQSRAEQQGRCEPVSRQDRLGEASQLVPGPGTGGMVSACQPGRQGVACQLGSRGLAWLVSRAERWFGLVRRRR
jgi:hypothetical protein